MSVGPVDDNSPGTGRHRQVILAVVLLSVLVVSMDNSILYVALKTLAEPSPTGLGAGQGQLQWAVDAYTLAYAGLLLSAGVVGNRVGHKRLLLTGLLCFGGLSALSAFAGNPGELIACRAAMGVAAALIMPATLAIVTRVFPGEARARAIGIWSAVVGAALAIGPLVAGALLGSFWWGSVFLVNVPVVAVVVPAMWFLVPEFAEHGRRPLDPPGVLLAAAGLVGVVYGVIRGGDLDSWTTPEVYVPIVAGLVLLGGFAAFERRVSQPTLDVRYFRNGGFTASVVALAMLFFALFGGTFIMTFYLQSVRGYSALRAGVCILPLACALIAFAPRAPVLVRRFGARTVAVAGMLAVALAMLGLASLGRATALWYFEVILFAFGTGMAHVLPPATAQIVATLPEDQAGTSSAVNNTFRQVGGALGIAVLGSILSAVYRGRIGPDLKLLPASLRAPAESSITGTLQVLRAIGGPAQAYVIPAENAFMRAMRITWLAGAIVVFAAAIVVFLVAANRRDGYQAPGGMTGGSAIAGHTPGDPDAGDRIARLEDGDIHVVEDGRPDAPAMLLIHGLAASTAWWDPVVPQLAAAYRVIRVDLPGHGRSASPVGGYDIPAQARRVGAALDSLGAGQVTVIGHSTGGSVATALAEQRPGAVASLALIDTGPNLDAKFPEGSLVRLMLAPPTGRLLWRLRTEATIRKSMRTAFTRPIDIPQALIEDVRRMTYRAFAATARAPLDYLGQRSLPVRLAALGLPVLVIFGADDQRWRSSSAAAYRVVPGARVELLPGVGHTPMLEDPQATGKLLLDFAAAAGHPS